MAKLVNDEQPCFLPEEEIHELLIGPKRELHLVAIVMQ